MSSDPLTIVAVHVTIHEQDGVYSAQYDPTPAVIPGAGTLAFSLDTPEWAFGTVSFTAPFYDLQIISPTQFTIADAGGPRNTVDSFRLTLVQTAPRRGEEVLLVTDPEVLNGPPA